ncbi:hypothetical protein BDY17DRAFT_295146 [Neohortaea acidophila]|uniref:F-box domain-containing protein n=1 Tax=Neohortaea acidophila TaxID=245834 RepID=A0A6A6PVJ5_9PEZI|nr:uncharacterized protein BDY17DRAFT_295146 [Neohortaea acidophila]KAF2484178.1 hypothetical protein BDY17DRAFT_295146 [Neohortaea acidophila]
MDIENLSDVQRVFAVSELLEHILLNLPSQLLSILDNEDPRSVRVYNNARILSHLLRLTEVNRQWHQCIHGSKRLQRALFLQADSKPGRPSVTSSPAFSRRRKLIAPTLSLTIPWFPQLNPIIQSTFPSYHFRFWRSTLPLVLEAQPGGHMYSFEEPKGQGLDCFALMIFRCDVPAIKLRAITGQGRSISKMQLSKPPCVALQCSIWDERDETRDYVGLTKSLAPSVIRSDEGVTLGMVHEAASKCFDEYRDVSCIKFTTSTPLGGWFELASNITN